MTAYYNEIDPYAAQWLRNLIAAGHIAPGHVDTRSVEDVRPSDLAGFRQCHFFAGIGVWSYALRRAGVPDGAHVWTGSCPCQPFSAAGKGAGMDDQRHLWPAWQWLISQCKPARIYGEQVASRDAGPWLDLVHADLEAMGYAFGAVPFPSASIGAPHIRDRLYWVALSSGERHARPAVSSGPRGITESQRGGAAGRLAHAGHDHDAGEVHAADPGQSQADRPADITGGRGGALGTRPGPADSFWSDADWLLCRDGKWRPVEPGTFPLAHGAAARVGRLRAYGNAINAEAARIFIEATL